MNLKIARTIVWILSLIIFCIINWYSELYKKNETMNTTKKKHDLRSLLISAFCYIVVTVGSSPVVNPLNNIMKIIEDKGVEKIAEAIKIIPISDAEESDLGQDTDETETKLDQNEDETKIEPDQNEDESEESVAEGLSDSRKVIFKQEEENRLQYHPAIPIENRALVPEESLYPDIGMEAISLFDSGGTLTEGYQGAERTSEAVTYAFTAPSDDSAALFQELEKEILKNPLVGHMIVQGIRSEYSTFKMEPLLDEFADACDAAFELPTDTDRRGLAIWYRAYRFPDNEVGIYVTDAYRTYSEALCQMLEEFTNYGVQNFEVKKYYGRNSGVEHNYIRTVALGEVGRHPALVLYKTNDKGEVVCVIGFNLNDKDLFLYNISQLFLN